MKLLLLFFLSLPVQADMLQVLELKRKIIKIKRSIKAPYALTIAKHTYKVSMRYDLDPNLLIAIFAVESAFKLDAVRGKTDYGIGQIHISNIRLHEFCKTRLVSDLEYSINAAAMILAEIRKDQGRKEKYYWVRYNCGSKSLKRRTCKRYKRKVKRWYK